jgi:hypothetical protein
MTQGEEANQNRLNLHCFCNSLLQILTLPTATPLTALHTTGGPAMSKKKIRKAATSALTFMTFS